MGSIFKKTFTKRLPDGAEIVDKNDGRIARWRDAKGKLRSVPVTTGLNGSDRIVVTASTYTAKFRDGSGIVREVATGCKDATAAKQALANLEKRADGVRSGIRSVKEDDVVEHRDVPIAEHFDAYIAHQRAKGLNKVRIKNNRSRLDRLAADCKFKTLADLDGATLQAWLDDRQAEKMSAGNRNEFRQTFIGFANWCIKPTVKRLLVNPFVGVPMADARLDRRRKRRSMTGPELVKLLAVAQQRPLREAMLIRRGPRKGELAGKVKDSVRQRLELLGRERALIYKTMVLTGLRKNELASLTVGSLSLDGPIAVVQLEVGDEKNREGNSLPLRADLADDLRQWLAGKLEASRETARRKQQALPSRLPLAEKLFRVPAGLVKILDRDLALAGIDKRDERGYTLDVHAIRHSFSTLLSQAGVAPRTAQAAMRHSTIDLTMNVYTDPKLLDVHGAVGSLFALPLGDGPNAATPSAALDLAQSSLAPPLAPTADFWSQSLSIPVKTAAEEALDFVAPEYAISPFYVNEKDSLTTAVNESSKWTGRESNPRPLHCERSVCASLNPVCWADTRKSTQSHW